MFSNALASLAEIKIVPVVVLDQEADAVPLAEALCAGGLNAAEVTFRTQAAEASIRAISKRFPNMTVGAGTLSSVEQAQRALDAGASFFVSAGFHRGVTEFALEHHVPIYPGVCTPTELMLLLEYGLPLAKFFPAAQFGGLDTIKALAGPFPQMKFMPTGGVGPANVLDYLSFDKVIACGGSWMVKPELIRAGDFARIQTLTQEAVELVKGAKRI